MVIDAAVDAAYKTLSDRKCYVPWDDVKAALEAAQVVSVAHAIRSLDQFDPSRPLVRDVE